MAVLVTGGAGYIGSHCVARLLRQGVDTVVVDSLATGYADAVGEGARLHVGDLRDRRFLDVVFDTRKIDAVIHFAAFSLVAESVADPQKYFENNLGGILALLAAMKTHGTDTLVFSSTASTYGEPIFSPVTEEHPQSPVNPYGESKLACERVLHWYSQAYGVKYCALRYFNVAGAAPDGSLGERHGVETHLIPNILKVAGQPSRTVTLFGNDYPTPDGTCVRDYIHVEDLVDAHIKALEYLHRGGVSRAFNLGIGQGYSNLEVLKTCRSVTGLPIPSTFGSRRPGDPAVLVASGDAARKHLGFVPERTLSDMVRDAWCFIRRSAR